MNNNVLNTDKSHIDHAIYAVIFQIFITILTGDNWWAGAAGASSFFIARAHAQAEERYIHANGGKRYETPLPAEFGALNPKYWNVDSVLDFVVPVIVVVSVAIIFG